MKILELPQLENIDSMKRKDIISAIRDHYVAPNQAANTRLEIAINRGRKVASLVEWLERADKFSDYDIQEFNDVKLGDELGYVVTKRTSCGYSMTQKYGRVFAIHGHKAMLCIRGGLRSVSLEKETPING